MVSIALGVFILCIVYVIVWSIMNDKAGTIRGQTGIIRMRLPPGEEPAAVPSAARRSSRRRRAERLRAAQAAQDHMPQDDMPQDDMPQDDIPGAPLHARRF